MKRENEELKIDLSVQDADLFEDTFAGFEENAEVTDAEKQRVLSSVMRKAGFEMNEIINEKRKNITASKTDDTEVRRGRIQVKCGGIIAACIAVLAVGAVTAGVLNMNNINADIPKPASRPTSDVYATCDEDIDTTDTDYTDTTDDNAENIMPDLVGRKLTDVLIEYNGKLRFDVVYDYNSEYEDGIIIEQYTPAGTPFKEGDYLELKVSNRQQNRFIPDVSGSEHEVAESELSAAGFIPYVKEIYSDEVPEGIAIKTEPGPGTKASLANGVTLFISKGKLEDPNLVSVPDVIGMTEDEAVQLLKDIGLNVKIEHFQSRNEKGTVVDQAVVPGDSLNKDEYQTIYVSDGLTGPVQMTLSLPLPKGLRGTYRIDACTNNNTVISTTTIDADTLGENNSFALDLEGVSLEKITVKITSNETGKSTIYAETWVNFIYKTADLTQGVNTDDLLALNPAE